MAHPRRVRRQFHFLFSLFRGMYLIVGLLLTSKTCYLLPFHMLESYQSACLTATFNIPFLSMIVSGFCDSL